MPTDTEMIDFLASLEQSICDVTMPKEIVQNNLDGGLRGMISACMRECKWDSKK